jgi:hypothetical protein
MAERQQPQNPWQYVLVWTPGSPHSSYQLWAASAQGRRTLWDSWETTEFTGTPGLAMVLNELYVGALEAQERSLSRM